MAAIASIAGCSYARVARADDAAGADVLFAQAKSLMDQERAAEACPKFESSYKLDPALGIRRQVVGAEIPGDRYRRHRIFADVVALQPGIRLQ